MRESPPASAKEGATEERKHFAPQVDPSASYSNQSKQVEATQKEPAQPGSAGAAKKQERNLFAGAKQGGVEAKRGGKERNSDVRVGANKGGSQSRRVIQDQKAAAAAR